MVDFYYLLVFSKCLDGDEMKVRCESGCCEDGLVFEGRVVYDLDGFFYFEGAGFRWPVYNESESHIKVMIDYPMCGSQAGCKKLRKVKG